ncbi:MAG: type II toxin-antitoxin system VapC family toxin [Nitrosotalea sp.]
MAKIIFDTSILIDCLRGNARAVGVIERVAKREIDGFISVLTEAELYAGRECGTDSGISKVGGLTSLFTKILLTNEIAQQAGLFRRKYKVEIPDAIIAATASVYDAKVWTKNIKDFVRIKEATAEDPY